MALLKKRRKKIKRYSRRKQSKKKQVILETMNGDTKANYLKLKNGEKKFFQMHDELLALLNKERERNRRENGKY